MISDVCGHGYMGGQEEPRGKWRGEELEHLNISSGVILMKRNKQNGSGH